MFDTINSYGAVVLEKTAAGCMVLLVTGYNGLSFPKGHIEANETPEQAAVREVWEETGIHIALDTTFSRTVVSPRSYDRRTVTFFLASSLDGLKKPHAAEVKEALWLPLNKALSCINYPPDRNVLEQAAAYLEEKFCQN
ncbi:MAG: NUDIX domain-containing protein [Eubacteriales bacterium]|nr:NUDIX domain-containing protein [Eubacteriales bacterium]